MWGHNMKQYIKELWVPALFLIMMTAIVIGILSTDHLSRENTDEVSTNTEI
jgi:putative exporter of polyketide antibiotics